MTLDPRSVVIVALAALVVAFAIWGFWLRGRAGVASRRRNRRAQDGEVDAEEILREEGYEIIERQARRSWTVRVDGEDQTAEVRADLLVRRNGRTWVAEVKTGRLATDPLHPPTRRQLLEYLFVFDPDGILLVDADAGTLVEVEFPEV